MDSKGGRDSLPHGEFFLKYLWYAYIYSFIQLCTLSAYYVPVILLGA